MQKLALLAVVIGVALCSESNFKLKYDDIISGRLYLNAADGESRLREMYDDFLATFRLEDEDLKRFVGTQSRFEIFKESVAQVQAHNRDPTQTWTMGINQFSDMTWEEFKKYNNLEKPQECNALHREPLPMNRQELEDMQRHHKHWGWDWNQIRKVPAVKNQGSCGSCWTFSTAGAMESHIAIKYGFSFPKIPLFSEQQLVDCAGGFNNNGCYGGLPSQAFEYIHWSGGLTTAKQYPYQAKDGNCTFDKKDAVAGVWGGSFNLTEGDDHELTWAIWKIGPASVGYQVVDDFRHYERGVYQSKTCNNTSSDINHAVLATGFGEYDGTPFYNIKNSWGTEWGDLGYFKMLRGPVNMCGILVCNSFPQDVFLHRRPRESDLF